jgi:hypothetical protein
LSVDVLLAPKPPPAMLESTSEPLPTDVRDAT